MHFADLALCYSHNGPYDAEQWQSPLLAVGWLESPHAFATGRAPNGLVARLEAFIDASARHYPSQVFRGRHDCTLCLAGLPRGRHLSEESGSWWFYFLSLEEGCVGLLIWGEVGRFLVAQQQGCFALPGPRPGVRDTIPRSRMGDTSVISGLLQGLPFDEL